MDHYRANSLKGIQREPMAIHKLIVFLESLPSKNDVVNLLKVFLAGIQQAHKVLAVLLPRETVKGRSCNGHSYIYFKEALLG